MPRNFPDFLSAYIDYSGYGEAPKYMSFWTGVATVAGALRRRVWIDQTYFRWYPNFYVVLVAPPGVVAKSSTVTIGMSLLREVPDIIFGPDTVTWQALVTAFLEAKQGFQLGGLEDDIHFHSSMTLESSEFGNLLDPRDKDMVDLLVSLWDGKQGSFKKATKGGGEEAIENPWINLIACTTPAWIAMNFPEYMIGGGFTSRCIFVYAEEKKQLVPYLSDVVPEGHDVQRQKLIEDLTDISTNIMGEYKLSNDAKEWGREWYTSHYSNRAMNLEDDRFGGYIARKQTHIHKLAMVIAASESNSLTLHPHHLQVADQMVTDLEPDMARVFSRVGKADTAFYADRLINYIQRAGTVLYTDAYRFVHTHFPSARDFEDVLAGMVKAGFVELTVERGESVIKAREI